MVTVFCSDFDFIRFVLSLQNFTRDLDYSILRFNRTLTSFKQS